MIASDILRAITVLALVVVDTPRGGVAALRPDRRSGHAGRLFSAGSQCLAAHDHRQARALDREHADGDELVGHADPGCRERWLRNGMVGPHAVFVIDALTYLLSAWFIWRATIPQETDQATHDSVVREAAIGIADGFRHLWQTPRILRLGVVKATFSMAAGGLVYLLALLGEAIEPTRPAIGMGILLAARGLGTGVGPVAARALWPNSRSWPKVIGASLILGGVFLRLRGCSSVGLLDLPSGIHGSSVWRYGVGSFRRASATAHRGSVPRPRFCDRIPATDGCKLAFDLRDQRPDRDRGSDRAQRRAGPGSFTRRSRDCLVALVIPAERKELELTSH